MIKSCLSVNESNRISLDKILKHNWLENEYCSLNLANEINETELIPNTGLVKINRNLEVSPEIEVSEVVDLILDSNDSGINMIEIVSNYDRNSATSTSSCSSIENERFLKFDLNSSITTIDSYVNTGNLISNYDVNSSNNFSSTRFRNEFEIFSKCDNSLDNSNNADTNKQSKDVSIFEAKSLENKKRNFWLESAKKIREKFIRWCHNIKTFYQKLKNFN